ncbi:MAG TPA: restriction endonuclease subunit S [Caulobacteraceae bacterium]
MPLGEVAAFETRRHDGSAKPYIGLEYIEAHTGKLTSEPEVDQVLSATFAYGPEHVLYGRLRPYLNKVYRPDVAGHCSTEIYPLRPHKTVSRDWLFYWLTSPGTVTAINEMCTGTRMPRADLNAMLKMGVPVPPLDEQQRIVAVLDEAFEAIATATANTRAQIARIRGLFSASAAEVLGQKDERFPERLLGEVCNIARGGSPRPIQAYLTDAADGVNWIKIGDATASNRIIYSTDQRIRPEGVSRSRKVSAGDLLLSNSMSFGRPYVLGVDGCIHDGWLVLSANPDAYDQTFMYHLLGSEFVYRQFDASAAGSTVRNLNTGSVGRVRIRLPSLDRQREMARKLDDLEAELATTDAVLTRKLNHLDELKQSLLARAFFGELMVNKSAVLSMPANDNHFTTPEQVANIIAFAHRRHELKQRQATFGRVKGQKNLHLIESVGGVELGRRPFKDAAGPNDFAHMLKAEEWARAKGFFEFIKRGEGYDFRKLANYSKLMTAADEALAPVRDRLERATDLIVDMDSHEAEVFATVHAAWNNLILDGVEPNDDTIVREARDEWHVSKHRIPASEFKQAIRRIRQKGVVPDGNAKRVGEPRLL